MKQSRADLEKLKGDHDAFRRLLDESQGLHKAALAQLESTLGPYHHRVADLCHKMADHMIARGLDKEAQ